MNFVTTTFHHQIAALSCSSVLPLITSKHDAPNYVLSISNLACVKMMVVSLGMLEMSFTIVSYALLIALRASNCKGNCSRVSFLCCLLRLLMFLKFSVASSTFPLKNRSIKLTKLFDGYSYQLGEFVPI